MRPLSGAAATWPLTVKVPLLVVLLMVGVAAVISHVVLLRLEHDQETNLRLLTGAYLDGLSTAVLPAVIRRDVWETFDALDRARGKYEGVEARSAIIELPDGSVLASSDPLRIPSHHPVPSAMRAKLPEGARLVIDEREGRAWVARTLAEDGFVVGRILAEIDITALQRVRREVLTTLVLVNGALTLGLAAIGYFLVRRMLHPLQVLTRHVDGLRVGSVDPIPDSDQRNVAGEFGRLFERFNVMARAVAEREALATRLAQEEKFGMLGKLASGMAHEVNNPLGGMLNAIDTLEMHGADPMARRVSLEFLRRGLASVRNVVRAALVTYKGGEPGVLSRADLDDLPFLIQHETGLKHLHLDWRNELPAALPIDGAPIRQVTLNLLLNACAASPAEGAILFEAAMAGDRLRIVIGDNGPGMPVRMAAVLEDCAAGAPPPVNTPGLGLWTTARLVQELGGVARIERPVNGTRVVIEFPVAHRTEVFDAVA
jgi:signal transduction histidine kinase